MMKKVLMVCLILSVTSVSAFAVQGIDDFGLRLSKLDVEQKAGVFIPDGGGLDVSYLAGFDLVWNVNDVADLKLGIEYTDPNVDGGKDLSIIRIPVTFTSKLKEDLILDVFYFGFGGTFIYADYADSSNWNDVSTFGLTALVGMQLSKKLSIEAKYDGAQSDGRNYGGLSVYFNFDWR